MKNSVVVIGSGFAGLSAASFLAQQGCNVTVLERHDQPGGRARTLLANGFTFDMGPSWYWMPDIFERYFAQFGKKVSDYYTLKRLDPSYRIYWQDEHWDVPADYYAIRSFFEKQEYGAAIALDRIMKEAAYKYEIGMHKLVFKPGRSLAELLDLDLLKGICRLDVFTSIKKHFSKHFTHPKIRALMEFPVLFLGALAENTPALYSLMNYADMKGGTWFPVGGMHQIVKAMYQLATTLGVQFLFHHDVQHLQVSNNVIEEVIAKNKAGNIIRIHPSVVVSNADYHFTETQLLPPAYRSYNDRYWNKRTMAPSCLLYYVGIDKKIPGLQHHSLFFDKPFDMHAREIYTDPKWPSNPLFYVSATSVTDASLAPQGCENLFFLIPVAAGLQGDSEMTRKAYFNQILDRFEKKIGEKITNHIKYYRSYALSDFTSDYHAFRGNAYGLANTLKQTAFLKPACKSKKVKNLFFTGQLTVPGPGVPPALISGEVVAKQVMQSLI